MELLRSLVKAGGLTLLLLPSLSLAITDKEAIKKQYKDCKLESKTAMISGDAAEFHESSLYSYYTVDCKDRKLNAFPVSNYVKIGKQKLIVIADKKRVVKKVIKISFVGGSSYRPTASWYDKFKGVQLDKVADDVDGITGASFTTKSTFEIMDFVKTVSKSI